MSQNAHTLLLFFDKEEPYRKCLKILRLLESDKTEQAEKLAEEWGVDFISPWDDDWFNHDIVPTSKFIRIDYETSTGYKLPLALLQQLFNANLRAACIEVFYSQVGEYEQFYFMDGELVEDAALFKRFTRIQSIVEKQFDGDSEELDDHGYDCPSPISELVKQNKKQEVEAQEMVDALVGLTKVSRETGGNPLEILKSVMMLRAAGKGLLHAIGFGVITVLLFKGMWLWISLSILLCIVLPIFYVSQVGEEFEDDEEQEAELAC